MKFFKNGKMVALVLLMALCLVFAAACNRERDEDESGNGAPVANDDDVVSTAGLHAPRDLGGRTLRFHSWWDGSQTFVNAGEAPDPATAGNYYAERRVWENTQRVMQEFNISFDFGLTDFGYNIPTLTTAVMAGAPNSELHFVDGTGSLITALGDIIVPIDSINLPGSDLLGPRVYSQVRVETLGHLWTFGPNEPNPGAMTMGVNLDIINAIGAPNPVELYNAGQWNWANALDIMRNATADTTGDGTIDRWGLAGQPGDIIAYFIGGNDGILVTDDLNFGMDHPNTVEALEFMELIFREGLWEFCPVQGADPGDWGRNFWAAHDGNSALFSASYWTLNYGDLPFEFAIVPFPTGPSNTSGNTWMGGWQQGFSIPTANANWTPAEVLMIFEELVSWPGDEPELLAEDVHNMLRARYPTEADMMRQLNATNTMANEMGMVVPEYFWVLGDFVGYFLRQEMTVSQALEAHRGPRQELLDNFFR